MLYNALLGPFMHANGDGEEIVAIEKAALSDEGVKAAIAKLQLPEGTVVISDPWIYGKRIEGKGASWILTPNEQALTVSMTRRGSTSATCTCGTRLTLLKLIQTIMHYHFPSRQSSRPRT